MIIQTKHTFTKEFNHNYIIYQPNIHIQLNYFDFIPTASEINLFVLFQSFQRIRINKMTQLKINYTVSPNIFQSLRKSTISLLFSSGKKDDEIGKPQITKTHELLRPKPFMFITNLTIKLSCKLDNMR